MGEEDEKGTCYHAMCVYVTSLCQLTSFFAGLQYMASNFKVLPFLESFIGHIHAHINSSMVGIALHC